MRTFQLPKSGTTVTDDDKGLHIIIPAQKQWGTVILSGIALCMVGVATILMIATTPDVLADPTDPSKPIWFFALFLLILIAADVLFLGLILWTLVGRVIIYINSINIRLRREAFCFAHEQRFDVERVRGLQVRSFKQVLLSKDAAEAMDNQTFNTLLEIDVADFTNRQGFFDRLMQADITNPQELRSRNLKTPKDLLAPYRFSEGFCSGITFDYDTRQYEFGVGLLNGTEAEQVVDIITQRYRILKSRK